MSYYLDVVRRTDGTPELVFCPCGTALDLRTIDPYLPRTIPLPSVTDV